MRKIIKKMKRNVRKIKLKPKTIALLCFLIVGIFTLGLNTVFADQDVTFELTTDKAVYQRGETVVVTYKFNTNKNWNNASAKIFWDTQLLQKPSGNSGKFNDNVTNYDGSDIPDEEADALSVSAQSTANSHAVPVMNLTPTEVQFNGGRSVGTFNLKVKDDAAPGDTEIYFQDNLTYLEDGDTRWSKSLQNATITISVPVTDYGVTTTSLALDVANNPTGTIDFWEEPEGANDPPRNPSFTGYDTSVVTVDSEGVVTAVGPGSTDITISQLHGDSTSFTVHVEVTSHVTDIYLDSASVNLNKGQQHTFVANKNPGNATDTVEYVWSTSDESVATVNPTTGQVTAAGGGDATITATARINGVLSDTIKASAVVHVSVPLTSVSANPSTINLVKGSHDSETINVEYTPSDTTDSKNISWSVAPSGVITINENTGEVTAVSGGTATVTGTSDVSGVAPFQVTVNVSVPISTFNVSPTSQELYTGQSFDITPAFTPAVDTITETHTVGYTVSPATGVVTVDNSGHVVATGAGTATITATTGEGGRLTKEVSVTVYEPISGATMSSGNFTLYTNDSSNHTKTLTVSETPSGAGKETDKNVTWESSNPAAATVDQNGLVTAVANGTSTITATLSDANHTQASVVVTVNTKVESLTLETQPEVSIGKTETHQIQATVGPANASDKTINWESSVAGKVTLTPGENGTCTVTGVAEGTTVVTGTAGTESVSVTVHVVVPTDSVTITQGSSMNLSRSDTGTLGATVSPSDATNKTVTWSSNHSDIVSVNEETGAYTAHKGGTAIITATAGGKSASITMNVIVHASSFSITDTNFTLNKDNYRTLNYNIAPDDVTDTIVWTSSDSTKVSVDEDGKVTALQTTEANSPVTITGTVNGIESSVEVTVILPATAVTINGERNLTIEVGDTPTLTATIQPSGSTDSVNWESGNENYLTIDSHGQITAIAPGDTTITARVGSLTDTISVSVKLYATNVEITEGTSIDVNKGNNQTIHAVVTPTGSSDPLQWSSSDNSKVTVTPGANGTATVTAHAKGYADITARAGSKQDTIRVNVKVPTTSISIVQGDSLEMIKDANSTLTTTIQPNDYTDTVSWSSSDDTKVEVVAGENGSATLTAHATTTTPVTITVTSGTKQDTISVSVVLPASSVTIAGNENITIHRGENQVLTATVLPVGTTDALQWITGNSSIASVTPGTNGTATITANAIGNTTITARAGNKTDVVNVTVDAPITAFTTDEQNVSVVKKQSKDLTYTITPSDTTDSKTITWESTSPSIVTVDNGRITGVSQGNTTVIAHLGSRSITYNVEVTIVPLTGLSLNKDNLAILRKQVDSSVTYTLTPANTTEETTAVWSSDNTAAATVDQDGNITGVAEGEADITVTMGGFSDSVHVVVSEVHLTGITMTDSVDTMEMGSNYHVPVLLQPLNCTDDVVFTYESSDPTIATVDADGKVTGHKLGKVTIRVQSSIGDYEAEIDLNIVEPVKPVVPNTGTKSAVGYIIAAIISLLGSIIIAKKRFN